MNENLRSRVLQRLERATRPSHFYAIRHLGYCVRNPRYLASVLGVRHAVRFAWTPLWYELVRSLTGRAPSATYALHSPAAAHPIQLRFDTSDLAVFRQIFVEREFAPLEDLRAVETIIDCGANIGCASALFLTRHPGARLVAVEPDPENFERLRANLAPYGDRVELHQNAVWKQPARLKLVRDTAYRHHWAVQVRECDDSEPCDLVAVDLPTLASSFGDRPIDLLKVDIEGAELALFADPAAAWIRRVRVCTVESHSEEANAALVAAFPAEQFSRAYSGELTIFRRRQG
jgi:FkbM family methyltransferase